MSWYDGMIEGEPVQKKLDEDYNKQLMDGTLIDNNYYVETKDGEYTSMYLGSDEYSKRSVRCKKLKILEPVPTYEEHMMTKDCAKRLFEAAGRETKLKMLLEECLEVIAWQTENYDEKPLLEKINEVLNERKS